MPTNLAARPTFVYFDLGNVLLRFDHAIAARNLAKLLGVTERSAWQWLFESGMQVRYETGQISDDDLIQNLYETFSSRPSAGDIFASISDIFWPNDGILQCLDLVRSQGVRMGLLSNTCSAHWNWIRNQSYAMVENWFAFHILSFEVGAMKPSASIYQHAARQAGVDPERILFIDDREENVLAADQQGWQTIHFRDSAGLLEDLRKCFAE